MRFNRPWTMYALATRLEPEPRLTTSVTENRKTTMVVAPRSRASGLPLIAAVAATSSISVVAAGGCGSVSSAAKKQSGNRWVSSSF